MLNLNVFAQDTQTPYISLAEICSKTGFSMEDCLAEIKNRGIAPIQFGNGIYLTADNIAALFAQSSSTDFVNVPPISATTLDNSIGSELSSTKFQNDKEVRRVANATISFISKKGRKSPHLVQWRTYFTDGTSKRESHSFATREEAERFAAELNKENTLAEQPPTELDTYKGIDSSTPFIDYAKFYVLSSGQVTCTDRTKKCYMQTIERIRKRLDKYGLAEITLGELDDSIFNRIIDDITKDCCQSTLNKTQDFIKRVLQYAFDRDILEGKCYVKYINRRKSSIKTEKCEPYTKDELNMLLNAAMPNTRLYALICLALYSGMRPAEIRALKWDDIDFANKVISVKGAVKRHYEDLEKSDYSEFIDDTKSESGIRSMALADKSAEVLQKWRAKSLNNPVGKKSEFIFFSKDGDAMKEEQLNSLWQRFINSHGWQGEKYMLYRFRHTYCTHLLVNDISPQKVQVLMGDSSISVIMNNYNGLKSGHIIDETRDVVNNMF